jgi:hypothetical protein
VAEEKRQSTALLVSGINLDEIGPAAALRTFLVRTGFSPSLEFLHFWEARRAASE